MTISVIIATNGRAEDLRECFKGLKEQLRVSDEVIVSHGGTDEETKEFIKQEVNGRTSVKYFNFGSLGAARQRNAGALESSGDILVFLDDDVVCEPEFIESILEVFENDKENQIGGVSATITNQTYIPLTWLNRVFFAPCLRRQERSGMYAGKVVGPAVNFLPVDGDDVLQEVEWLPSCCCAYRKDVFLKSRFGESFRGYSFMEDVELSLRVGKESRLVNTTKARCFHKDLGGETHGDWREIGRMQVINRWHVMTDVLGKAGPVDRNRFLYYQLYCILSESGMLFRGGRARSTFLRWYGRAQGILAVLSGT